MFPRRSSMITGAAISLLRQMPGKSVRSKNIAQAKAQAYTH